MKHTISYHPVPRETFTAVDDIFRAHHSTLEAYVNQLFWWNKRLNLVSRDVSRETITEHISHSLILTQLECFKEAKYVVDAGTGGGLPGIPLAVANPEKEFLLNDIVTKKILAVRQMKKKLSLENADTADRSISEISVKQPFLLVSKHAFKIDDLYNLTAGLPWTNLVFYKGLDFKDELADIKNPLNISVYVLFENSENEFYKDKAIVVVTKISD